MSEFAVGGVLDRLVEIIHVELPNKGLKIGVFEVSGEGWGGRGGRKE